MSDEQANSHASMESRVARLEADVAAIKIDVAVIKANGATKADVAELRSEMGTGFVAIRADMEAGFAAIRSEFAAQYSDQRADMRSDISEAKSAIILWTTGVVFIGHLLPEAIRFLAHYL